MNELKKFWIWMSKNAYQGNYIHKIMTVYDELNTSCRPTKQMLIGYFMEYVISHEKHFYINHRSFKSIDDVYKYLYKKVKLMEGRE
jgi:hypothetical protein